MFENKEEKKARIQREQKQYEEEQRQQREKERKEREDRQKRRTDEFMADLEKRLKNNIITLIVSNDEGNEWKQLAMNYLLDKEYVCVQNDVRCTEHSAHFTLTFVKKEYKGFFCTR